jgi:hypothetical protein
LSSSASRWQRFDGRMLYFMFWGRRGQFLMQLSVVLHFLGRSVAEALAIGW